MSYLELKDLTKHFKKRNGLFGEVETVKAVDGVNLSINQGEILGLVGESGCGKSTLSRLVMQLIKPTSGSVVLEGEVLANLKSDEIRKRRMDFQMIFQDPYASLNPRMTVFSTIAEAVLTRYANMGRDDKDLLLEHVSKLMNQVGLDARSIRKYPHEFSGGQRQRIAIARAMVLQPKLVVLDEPTSALDRTVQKEVLDLLRVLQDEFNLSYIFISHDLAVIKTVADYVMVMRHGEIIEEGPTQDIFERPQQDYTKSLIASSFNLKELLSQV